MWDHKYRLQQKDISSKMLPSRDAHKSKLSGLILALLLGSCLTFAPTEADNDEDSDSEPDELDDSQLPSLWTAAMSGSYHVLYQLEMKNSVQLIEEWASFSKRQFRLDLIGHENGARTTFLTNGHTREMFRYKPFSCLRSDGNKMFKDLGQIAPLFIGHLWDDHDSKSGGDAYFAYGLGPLWLRAYSDGRKIERPPGAKSRASDDTELPYASLDYDEYEVEFGAEVTHTQEPYRLRFYFPKHGRSQFVDTVDWLLADSDGPGGRTTNYQVRAKVIFVDYKYEVDETVFKLPVGYGCSRRSELDPTLQIDVGQVLLHQGAPNQAAFEVITSFPNDDSLRAASWTSQKYSLRVMRLSQPRVDDPVKVESYYVTLAQFRESATGAEEGDPVANLKPIAQQQMQPKLKRIKKVWWAPDSEAGQATVYTIDQSTGECMIDHQDVREQVALTFGGAFGGGFSSSSSGEKKLAFSLDQISELFDDFAGYHLIDEGESFGPPESNKFRNRFYEKRVEHFELKSSDGEVAWWGPVSIVKQVSTHSQYLDTFAGQTREDIGGSQSNLNLSRDFRIKLIIFMYSANLDRVLFKMVIELLDNHEVSFGYATQQIDVSDCFPPEDKQDVVLKYPLESVELSRELESKRETIKQLVGDALFWNNGRVLTPLQVSGIRPSFDPFYMRVQMTLIDVPLTHTFKMEPSLRLVAEASLGWAEAEKVLLEMGASSAEICGQHCEYYNCLKFSYHSESRSCRVALDHTKTTTVEWPSAELYTYYDRRLPAGSKLDGSSKLPQVVDELVHWRQHERPHLSSDAIIQLMEELVEAAQTSDISQAGPTFNPLALRVNMQPIDTDYLRQPSEPGEAILLLPSAVEHDLETMNEYSRELAEASMLDDEGEGKPARQVAVRVRGDRQLRLEFKLLLNDRTFKQYSGETLTGVTYEQCEQHCELNDCRSFAYCLWDESCQISGQHNEKFLTSSSRMAHSDKHCNIYVLDYLSKFESYGRVPRPEANKVAATDVAMTAADCATACMDHQGFACQSFYFCTRPSTGQMPATSSVCLLMTKPAEISDFDSQKVTSRPALITLEDTASEADVARECSFYSRSYLAQFDKYLGKQINLEGVTNRLSIVGSLQDCAKHCLKSKCLAFDACPTSLDSNRGLFGGQTCHLLVDSLKREQLVPMKRCTTFVIADKSHFNSKNIKLLYGDEPFAAGSQTNEATLGKPDEEAIINDDDASPAGGNTDSKPADESVEDLASSKLHTLEELESNQWRRRFQQTVAGHSLLARLLSLSLGVLLGFGLILGWNEAYARGWLSGRLM